MITFEHLLLQGIIEKVGDDEYIIHDELAKTSEEIAFVNLHLADTAKEVLNLVDKGLVAVDIDEHLGPRFVITEQGEQYLENARAED